VWKSIDIDDRWTEISLDLGVPQRRARRARSCGLHRVLARAFVYDNEQAVGVTAVHIARYRIAGYFFCNQ